MTISKIWRRRHVWKKSAKRLQRMEYFDGNFWTFTFLRFTTLIKKLSNFPHMKFRVKQLQSHLWLTASSYMGKYLRISSYIRKPFPIYDFATAPLWISLYMRKIWFFFFISILWIFWWKQFFVASDFSNIRHYRFNLPRFDFFILLHTSTTQFFSYKKFKKTKVWECYHIVSPSSFHNHLLWGKS